MGEPITYVGIDAHKRELHIAMLVGDQERTVHWTAPADSRGIDRLRHKLEREAPGHVECCYEAGPTGTCCSADSPAVACDALSSRRR